VLSSISGGTQAVTGFNLTEVKRELQTREYSDYWEPDENREGLGLRENFMHL